MTMLPFQSCCVQVALPTQLLHVLVLLICAAGTAIASTDDISTTTTTIHSTTTIRTLTTTITSGQTTFATTEILTPGTTIYFTGPTPTPTMSLGSGHGAYAGNTFKNAVLNSTNLVRTQHEAKALKWNDTLANYAQKYAERCVWEHSGGPYGENLAEGYSTPTLAIDAWANEQKDYDYSSGQFGEDTGHFTQLVWKDSTSVGCGAVNCGDANGDQTAFGWYLVCEYSPPGNVIGRFQANVKPGTSKDGQIGSAAGRVSGVSRMLVALGFVSWFVVAYL